MPDAVTGLLIDNGPPPAGPLTAYELDVVENILQSRPTSVPTNTVPAPNNQRPSNMLDASWFTNVVYWLVYRHPQSLWRQKGHVPAPVVVPQNSPWAAIWERIYLAVSALLKDYPPPGDTVTPAEREVLDMVADFFAEDSFPEVEVEVVPAPDNEKPFFTDELDWATNVAFWTAYRAAHSEWKQAGHMSAPVKIPSPKSPWAPVWRRMREYLQAKTRTGGRLTRLAAVQPLLGAA